MALNFDPIGKNSFTKSGRREFDDGVKDFCRKKFINDTTVKWKQFQNASEKEKKQVEDKLNKIWEINEKIGIQDIIIDFKKEASVETICKGLDSKIDEWEQLYGREITSGSYASEPMPWIYIKKLTRYFLNPTNAAVFVMFFTLYSTYYWLDHQSYTLSEATGTVSTLISGIMTFMLTMTLSSGKDKEKEIIKKFEALSGDIKAMAMYLVHATYDHEKYLMQADGKLKYDNRVRDQFHKMQYLLAILSPTARKVLQGSRSFLFPEYLGDSNSFFRDLVNLRINRKDKRYFYLTQFGVLLTLWTLTFIGLVLFFIYQSLVVAEAIPLLSVTLLVGVTLAIFVYYTRWTEFRLCGWGCCCKSTPYADVDDLELIPFTEPRKKSPCNILYTLCCLSTKYTRKYKRWSEKQCDQNNKPENCTKGLEYALYRKIKETQERTGMDLFETEMTILLDEITKIGELNIGLGVDEGSAVFSAVLNKWELIYASWGEMSSVKTYSEPIFIQLYRAFFIFMYAFITPIKYLPLHENDNNWCIVDCKDGYSVDPYIWWTVVDVSVYAVLWWVAYYVRNPFDKELWFGRSQLIVNVSTSTQKQVNRFVMNAKHLEENDYQKGFRYGWGGKGNNPYPIGYSALEVFNDKKSKWVKPSWNTVNKAVAVWGEKDVNIDDVKSLAELNRRAGNMFNYKKVLETMNAKNKLYTPAKFREELLKTAYNTVYSETVATKYVTYYRNGYDEQKIKIKDGFITGYTNMTIMGVKLPNGNPRQIDDVKP